MPGKSVSGFALIEVLVVTAIVSLLVGVAGPSVMASIQRSKHAGASHNYREILAALDRYYQDRGHYPIKLGKLVDEGYLRSNFDFRCPLTRKYFFYAVDDNFNDTSPRRFVLAHPATTGNRERLPRRGSVPPGRDPNDRALAWYYARAGQWLLLYEEGDQVLLDIDDHPVSLHDYRDVCKAGATGPCDLEGTSH